MRDEVIVFDIGGTSMRSALMKNNQILKYASIPTPKTKAEFLEKIVEFIDGFNSSNVKGIGIGIAGPVKDGVIKNAPNLVLKNFDLRKYLMKKYHKRVEIKNDAECFTIAELKKGSRLRNFLLITVGTGIGGGIVIDGKDYRGMGYGAEFGHMYIQDEQWETLWKKTRARIKKEFGKELLIRDFVKMNDKKSKLILDECTDYFGKGIASLISAFDPEAVFIGGGVRDSGKYFIESVKKKVEKYSFIPRKTPIKWTTLENPGIIGASLLIKN